MVDRWQVKGRTNLVVIASARCDERGKESGGAAEIFPTRLLHSLPPSPLSSHLLVVVAALLHSFLDPAPPSSYLLRPPPLHAPTSTHLRHQPLPSPISHLSDLDQCLPQPPFASAAQIPSPLTSTASISLLLRGFDPRRRHLRPAYSERDLGELLGRRRLRA